MIELIGSNAVQQNTQVQSAQQQDNTGLFEFLMKTSVSKLSQKQESADSTEAVSTDSKKDSDKKEDSTGAQTLVGNAALAAMFQQTAGMIKPVFVRTQPKVGVQTNVAEIESAGTAQSTGTSQSTGTVQAANIAQNTDVLTAANSGQKESASSAAQGIAAGAELKAGAPTDGVLQQQVSGMKAINTGIPQTQQSNGNPVQNQIQPLTAENLLQTTAVPENAKAEQQNQMAPVLTQSDTQLKSTDSSSKLAFDGKVQGASFSELKTGTQDDTASQNQGSAAFADLFRTGNVIIPVSDKATNVEAPVCSQVTENIASNYKAGKSQFQIDLYPQDLGKVSVKLAVQNGVLTVDILAENPKTQSMLMANTGEIKTMLQSAVDQPVQVMQTAQDKAWYQQPQNQSNQSSAQQQEQQQRDANAYLEAQESDDSTADFLSVMQRLNQPY